MSSNAELLGLSREQAEELARSSPGADVLAPLREALVRSLANRSRPGDPPPAMPPAELQAHVIVSAIDEIRECHRDFGIPDDTARETLSYLGRAEGRPIGFWNWLRFTGWLYQVGRLEVTPYLLRLHPAAAGPLFWYDDEEAERMGPGFRRGDAALGVHVPPTGELLPAVCDESLARIRVAFRGVFPGKALRIATCTSWLMDDQLAEYLAVDSNIVAFQRRFTLVPGARDDDDAIGQAVRLAPHTTLERAVRRHLESGRHWRVRTGWMEL